MKIKSRVKEFKYSIISGIMLAVILVFFKYQEPEEYHKSKIKTTVTSANISLGKDAIKLHIYIYTLFSQQEEIKSWKRCY